MLSHFLNVPLAYLNDVKLYHYRKIVMVNYCDDDNDGCDFTNVPNPNLTNPLPLLL